MSDLTAEQQAQLVRQAETAPMYQVLNGIERAKKLGMNDLRLKLSEVYNRREKSELAAKSAATNAHIQQAQKQVSNQILPDRRSLESQIRKYGKDKVYKLYARDGIPAERLDAKLSGPY